MNKRLGAILTGVTAGAAAAGLFAGPSQSAGQPPNCAFPARCFVALTATGPSPSTFAMEAGGNVAFFNGDSVTHKVVFANGLCSLTLPPGQGGFDGGYCSGPFYFESYAGSYAYTVDGKFPGTVVTTAWPRSVTLRARTHTIRSGTHLTLHGRVVRGAGWSNAPPAPVVVFARRASKQPFERIATVRTKLQDDDHATYGWSLNVRPGVTTTYVAEVTSQRLCYSPASRCAHPQGRFWADARSRPFTVRIGK